MPVEMRLSLPRCSSTSEVIGSTENPWSVMMNGYSSPPCAEPRYFTTRSLRVVI